MCPELQWLFAVAAMITAIHAFSSKATPRVQVTVGRVRYSRRVRADFKNASIGHSRVVFAMLLFAQEVQAFAGPEVGRAVATVSEPPTMSGTEVTQAITRSVQEPASEAKGVSGAPTQAVPTAYSRFVRAARLIIPAAIVCIILLMYPGNVAQSMRMPPVYDPNDHTQSFRAWSQDLMLWTISNELQPHQQAAMVVAQLRGPAREMARSITPQELYHGGMYNGVHLDPVSYILQGLASRFAPLDDETRLRAAQELLSFHRRPHESIDGLITRFEIVRSRARQEGGGATVSTETAALLLLRACNCNPEQFQALTQPFGYRLPNTDDEFTRLCAHIRRLGHIVERQPLNIASTLRQGQGQTQHFHVNDAEQFGASSQDAWQSGWEAPGDASWNHAPGTWNTQDPTNAWAYPVTEGNNSDTDSATSSDSGGQLDTSDFAHLPEHEADQYLFGEYQHAKKRWRRFSGKPVRALRRVLRRKGKGKGKSKSKQRNSYLNIPEILEYYYKGKGKGKPTSGKGFGRRINPKDRQGQIMRCSICGSMYHLRARCNQSAPQGQGQSSSGQIHQAGDRHLFAQEGSVHFATFEQASAASGPPSEADNASWSNVEPSAPPQQSGDTTSASWTNVTGPGTETPRPTQAAEQATPDFPQVHQLTPDQQNDPWNDGQDPWSQGYHEWSQDAVWQPQPMQVGDPWMQWHVDSRQMQHAQPQQFNMVNAALNANSWFMPYDQNRPAAQYEQVQLPIMPQVSAIQEAVRAAEMQQSATSNAREPSSSSSQPPVWFQQPVRTSIPQAPQTPEQVAVATASEVVSIFAEVHAARFAQAERSRPQSRPRNEVRPFSNQCTICQQTFNQGEEILRIECGHMFHSICFSEMMQHSESEGNAVQCPNCRSDAIVVSTWMYAIPATRSEVPTEPPATPSQSRAPLDLPTEEEAADRLAAAVTTPVPSEHGEELENSGGEFQTPDQGAAEESYAWWPVPQPMRKQESFHAAALTEGCGLLVDPGSYGNLVGSEWLEQAKTYLHRAGKEILRFGRNSPLHVGGVGKGSQTCINDCMFPLALERSDGTMHEGTFTSPIVEQSHTPALLGLRSLMRHNAILDLGKKMMHLIPDDREAEYELPEGTESYPLKQAPSGHLLLPFTDFKKWEKRRFEKMNIKMIHLFTDDEPRTGESTASGSGLQRDTDVTMEDVAAAPSAGPTEMEVDSTPATAAPEPATEPPAEATRTAEESSHHVAESEPPTAARDDVTQFLPPSRKLHGAPQAARAAAGVEYGPVRRRQERPEEMEEVEVDEESGESRKVRQFRLTEAGVVAAAKAVPKSPPDSPTEPDNVPQPKTPPGPPPHLQAAPREAAPKAKRRQVPNPKGPPPKRTPPQPPQSTRTVILRSEADVNEAKAKGTTSSKASSEKAKAPVRQPPPPPAPKRRSTSEAAKASGSSASGPRMVE